MMVMAEVTVRWVVSIFHEGFESMSYERAFAPRAGVARYRLWDR
jgi:hypothetical protein